jgi:DNA-binding HxlR family transcriptional regulator
MIVVMALGTGYAQQNCSIARALEIVGERWTMLVLRDCFYGVRRFSDLLAHLDISRAVLTDRLATLVQGGLLERRTVGGHPEYLLTDAGIAFWPTLFSLWRWGERFAPGARGGRTFRLVDCGGELDDLGRCGACGTAPAVADLMVVVIDDAASRGRTDPVSRALRVPHRLLTPLDTPAFSD